MRPTPVLYHNPRCSKSREARQLLEDQGVEFELVRYLEEPPTRDELDALVGLLGGTPADLLRTNEPLAKELGLTAESDPAAILDALAEHPILIQRPVLVVGGEAVIARPAKRVLELI